MEPYSDTQKGGKGICICGRVDLPASKSISNRVLLIHALSGSEGPVYNLSDCDDTVVMRRILESDTACFDVGQAGTAMRFLTAFLARTAGTWVLDGSARMRLRPVGPLVEALNSLGARITYMGKVGFPPLQIRGSYLRGGTVSLPASMSSQFVSALMMIAPYMDQGLEINLEGKVVSASYIRMTAGIMQEFGAEVRCGDRQIHIAPGAYDGDRLYAVEADWSAASYFFELAAVSDEAYIRLPGLEENSRQGDSEQRKAWRRLGVDSRFADGGLVLEKGGAPVERLDCDFLMMPDLLPSFAVACCLKDIPFQFTGLETLRIKETDRIAAVVREAARLGCSLKVGGEGTLKWDGERTDPDPAPEIETYGDHRMAMAFAPALLLYPGLRIKGKEVVSKSFPAFWKEFGKLTVACFPY